MNRDQLRENLEHIDSTVYQFDTDTITVYVDKKSRSQLSESQYLLLRREHQNTDAYVEVKKYEIKGTEMEVRLKSGNKIISYPIGEMILINNKWNLFTKPSLYYHFIKE